MTPVVLVLSVSPQGRAGDPDSASVLSWSALAERLKGAVAASVDVEHAFVAPAQDGGVELRAVLFVLRTDHDEALAVTLDIAGPLVAQPGVLIVTVRPAPWGQGLEWPPVRRPTRARP